MRCLRFVREVFFGDLDKKGFVLLLYFCYISHWSVLTVDVGCSSVSLGLSKVIQQLIFTFGDVQGVGFL